MAKVTKNRWFLSQKETEPPWLANSRALETCYTERV
jgi:hypothetical protein